MKTSVHNHKNIEHLQSNKREKKLSRVTGARFKLCEAETKEMLAMYSDSSYTTSEIARRFGVCPASITNAAKHAGLPLRMRGRWPQGAPPSGVQDILLEAWTNTYDTVASRFGLTKQRIAKIVDRWREWATNQLGPRQVQAPKPAASAPMVQPTRTSETSVHVISFRVPTSVFNQLAQKNAITPPGQSPSQFARDLLLMQLKHHGSPKPRSTRALPGS